MTAAIKSFNVTIHQEHPVSKSCPSLSSLWSIPVKLYNTCLLVWKGELREPLSRYCYPSRWMSEFDTLFAKWHLTGKPEVMEALLNHPREGELFKIGSEMGAFQQVFLDAFPKATKDDCLFFCHENFVRKFRRPIFSSLSEAQILKKEGDFSELLRELAQTISRSGNRVNLDQISIHFTTSVISKLVLGHTGNTEDFRKIAEAVGYVNRYILWRAAHIPIGRETSLKYQECLHVLRAAIDISIEANWDVEDSLVYRFRTSDFTHEQIQCNLLLMFMGGSETTASLLNFLTWQLGQHPELQKNIYEELSAGEDTLFHLAKNSDSLARVFKEGIRLCTPAFMIGREVATDFTVRVADEKGRKVFEKTLRKGEGILCCPTFAGRDEETFENSETFDPSRFDKKGRATWLPFGFGAHVCPGQGLATLEIKAWLAWIIQNYEITSSPSQLHMQGFATLKAKEEVMVELQPRR